MFKISASEFCILGMYRRMQACTDEFLAVVTEDVVHSGYKVVTRACFGVTRHRIEVLGIMLLCHNFTYEPHTVVEGQGRFAQCL